MAATIIKLQDGVRDDGHVLNEIILRDIGFFDLIAMFGVDFSKLSNAFTVIARLADMRTAITAAHRKEIEGFRYLAAALEARKAGEGDPDNIAQIEYEIERLNANIGPFERDQLLARDVGDEPGDR